MSYKIKSFKLSKNIYSTARLHGDFEEIFRAAGYNLKFNNEDRILSADEIKENAKGCQGLITLLADKIDKNIIDSLPDCRIIANYAVGYNNIDVDYAVSKKIMVTNTPGILTEATAEIALALLLACSRRIAEGDRFMRSGKFKGWMPSLMLGKSLRGKTAGIIGAGRIGQAFGEMAAALGLKIIYTSNTEKPEFEAKTGAVRRSTEELIRESDVISLHVPLNESTRHMISADLIDMMKPECIFINTARGEITDEKYLIKALREGRIFAAGFDVYYGEPVVNPELFELENVVLLPHIGSASSETRAAMAKMASENIISYLETGKALNPVREIIFDNE